MVWFGLSWLQKFKTKPNQTIYGLVWFWNHLIFFFVKTKSNWPLQFRSTDLVSTVELMPTPNSLCESSFVCIIGIVIYYEVNIGC